MTAILTICLLAIMSIIVFPFASIWALNTLFHTTISFTFWNWLAALVLTTVVYGKTK